MHDSVRYHLLAQTNTQVFRFTLICNNDKIIRYVVVPSTNNCIISANVAIKSYMESINKAYHSYDDLRKIKTGHYPLGVWAAEPYPPAKIHF
jgi:hypothetical protein